MYKRENRKLYGSTKLGLLKDTVRLPEDDERVVTYWFVLKRKIRIGVGVCETYWYDGSKESRIRFKWDKDGLIVGRLNIKFGGRKKTKKTETEREKGNGETKDSIQM